MWKTIFTAISRASFPHRLTFGIVDQIEKDEVSCKESYCIVAQKEGKECLHMDTIRVLNKKESDSRGPT